MIVSELEGLEFDMDKRNCYSLVRDFYRLNFGVELSDYACPTDWWENGLDIFRDMAFSEGFEPIHEPAFMWRPGDVILMALHSRVGNHIGVIVPGGRMLHHLRDARSKVDSYAGWYRNSTVGVYRYPNLPQTEPEVVDLKDVLPKKLSRKLANYRSAQAAQNEA